MAAARRRRDHAARVAPSPRGTCAWCAAAKRQAHRISLYGAHAAHMQRTCSAHAVHMQRTCRAHAAHMPYTCSAHAVHMQRTCRAHAVHAPAPQQTSQRNPMRRSPCASPSSRCCSRPSTSACSAHAVQMRSTRPGHTHAKKARPRAAHSPYSTSSSSRVMAATARRSACTRTVTGWARGVAGSAHGVAGRRRGGRLASRWPKLR